MNTKKTSTILLALAASGLLAACGGKGGSSSATSSPSAPASSEPSTPSSQPSADPSSQPSADPSSDPASETSSRDYQSEFSAKAENSIGTQLSAISSGTLTAQTKSSTESHSYAYGEDDYGPTMKLETETNYAGGSMNDVYYYAHNYEGEAIQVTKDYSDAWAIADGDNRNLYGPAIPGIYDESYNTPKGAIGLLTWAAELAFSNEASYELDNEGYYVVRWQNANGSSTESWDLKAKFGGEEAETYLTDLSVEYKITDEGETDPSGTVNVTAHQVAGAHSMTLPFSLADFCYTAWDLTWNYVAISGGSDQHLSNGTSVALGLESTNANASDLIDPLKIELVSGEEGGLTIEENWMGWEITGVTIGEYVIKASTRNVSYTYNVAVTVPQPESVKLDVYSYDSEWNWYEGDYDVATFEGEPNVEYLLNFSVAPKSVSQDVQIEVYAGDEETIVPGALETKEINGEELEVLPVTFTAEGVWMLKVTTVAEPAYIDYFTFEIAEASADISGKYVCPEIASWWFEADSTYLRAISAEDGYTYLSTWEYELDTSDPDTYTLSLDLVYADAGFGYDWEEVYYDPEYQCIYAQIDGMPATFSKPSTPTGSPWAGTWTNSSLPDIKAVLDDDYLTFYTTDGGEHEIITYALAPTLKDGFEDWWDLNLTESPFPHDEGYVIDLESDNNYDDYQNELNLTVNGEDYTFTRAD